MTGDSRSQTSDGEADCGGSTLNEEQMGETIQERCEEKQIHFIAYLLFARFILDCMSQDSRFAMFAV